MKINKMNKKAVIFTILVIAMLSLFSFSYVIYSVNQDRTTINKRVNSLNDFVFSIEDDLSRKLYISGFRIIFLFQSEMIDTENYITDLDDKFEEAFFNGTINGLGEDIMRGANFSDIQKFLSEKGNKVNANVILNNPVISINQTDPWNVEVNLIANLFIEDKRELVSWNRTISIDSYVPVENFADPLYIIGTNGKITRKINQTIYDFSVPGDLEKHLTNNNYINSTLAPSFLDRLQGITTGNLNGIESLVYLSDLSSQGISVKDKSIVDYIYFSTNDPSTAAFPAIAPWFKIDDAHLPIYRLS